jgi:hypothetical protein
MKKANFNHFSFSFFQQPNGPRSKKKKKRKKAHRFGCSSLTRDLLGSERFRLNSLKSESDPRLSPPHTPTKTDPTLLGNYLSATAQTTNPQLPVRQLRLPNLRLSAPNHRNLHLPRNSHYPKFRTQNFYIISISLRSHNSQSEMKFETL